MKERSRHRIAGILAWIGVIFTIFYYFTNPVARMHGQDFFYYQSLARLSRIVPVHEFYHAQDELIDVEAASLGQRLRDEMNWSVSDTWVRTSMPMLKDPRFYRGPLPDRYYPEWSALREISTSPFSKVSPVTFGMLRAAQLDRLPFRDAYNIWKVVMMASILLSIFCLRETLRLHKIPYSALLLAALWFGPVRTSFAFGQFMEICFAAITLFLFLRYGTSKQSLSAAFMAGVFLSGAILIKPLALGLLVFVCWSLLFGGSRSRDAWTLTGFATGTALVIGATSFVYDPAIWSEWLIALGEWYGEYEYTIFAAVNRSAYSAFVKWFALDLKSPILAVLYLVYTACMLGIYSWYFLGPPRATIRKEKIAGAAMALLGFFVVSKFVLMQYEIFLLFPLAVLAAAAVRSTETSRQRELWALTLILWGTLGLYEFFMVLYWTRSEVFLFPLLLITLGEITRRGYLAPAAKTS